MVTSWAPSPRSKESPSHELRWSGFISTVSNKVQEDRAFVEIQPHPGGICFLGWTPAEALFPEQLSALLFCWSANRDLPRVHALPSCSPVSDFKPCMVGYPHSPMSLWEPFLRAPVSLSHWLLITALLGPGHLGGG